MEMSIESLIQKIVVVAVTCVPHTVVDSAGATPSRVV